jgi:hypothetical protein
MDLSQEIYFPIYQKYPPLKFVSLHSAPRSGSTWLQSIFESHPSIKTIYQPLFSYAFKNRLSLESSQEDFLSFMSDLYQTNDDFCCMKSELHGEINQSFDKDIITTLLIKNVRYHHLMPKLVSLDPSVKLIGLVRNPYSTIYSQMSCQKERDEDWLHGSHKNQGIEDFYGYEKWKQILDIYLSVKASHPENIIIVKYEDLVTDPERELKLICQYLKLNYHDNMRQIIDQYKSRQDDYEYSVYKTEDTINKWKGKLDDDIIKFISNDIKEYPQYIPYI